MASKGKKNPRQQAIEALNRISRSRPHPDDLWRTIIDAADSVLLEIEGAEINALTAFRIARAKIRPMDAAAFVLALSTILDQALELAISTHFAHVSEEEILRMFEDTANGPLSTFSAKIKMGYSLGLYNKLMRDELDLIRYIRNAFAHSWRKLDFESTAVVEGCACLRIPDLPMRLPEGAMRPGTPKQRFLASVRQLYVYLEWDSLRVGHGPMLFSTHPGRKIFEGG